MSKRVEWYDMEDGDIITGSSHSAPVSAATHDTTTTHAAPAPSKPTPPTF